MKKLRDEGDTLRSRLTELLPEVCDGEDSDELLAKKLRLYYDVAGRATGGIYVVATDDLELLYLNPDFRSRLEALNIPITAGATCHQVLCGTDTPCQNCILRGAAGADAANYVYNARLHGTFAMQHTETVWQGRPAAIVYAREDMTMRNVKGNLAIAMQHAKMLYWEYDMRDGCAYCSPMVREWFGTPEVLEDYPESYLHYGFVADEDVEAYRETCRKMCAGADYAEFDARVRTLQQGYEWMRIRMTGMRDADGKPARAICTAERIAEYKELEKQFTTTLHQNDIASWRYDLVRHTIMLNKNTYYSYARDENNEIPNVPESQIAAGLCYPDDIETFRQMYRRMDEGERHVEEVLRFRDSRTHRFRWEKCVYTVLTDDRGRPTYAVGSAIDITEQREAQRQYRAAVEYRKHTQTENLLISGHCSITDNRVLEMTDLTGMELGQGVNNRRDDFFRALEKLLCDEGQKAEFEALFMSGGMAQRFDSGVSESAMTAEIRVKGGRRVWVQLHLSAMRAPDTGDLEGFLTVTDITQAHVQQQLLRTALSCDYDYIASVNFSADTIVLYQRNEARQGYRSGVYYPYSDFTKHTRESLAEEKELVLFDGHMQPDFVRRALAESETSQFICHVREGENVRAKRVRFAAYDKIGDTVTFSCADVTELMQAEEAKQAELQRVLDEALRGNRIINNVASHDYDYVMVVDIAADRYHLYAGFTDESMRGTPKQGCYSTETREYAMRHVIPEDRHIAIEGISLAYVTEQLAEKTKFTNQARILDEDGRLRYKRANFYYLDEAHTQLLITRTDVTELILDEEKKRESLATALRAAEQATRAKTDFLSRMSHDLRTPMNAIIGLSALTIDDAEQPDAVRDNMTKMRYAGNFMLGLINDILDMAKIESGAVKLTPGPYAYKDFVVNMRTMFQAQCEEKGIVFDMPEPTHNPVANVDKVRINQIFFNILSNALKYTPRGGRITYRVANLQMDGVHAGGDCIISDSGIGMSEEFQKHMFEPFMQESSKVTPELQGTGLGLSITKQLVELMGGSIRIDSHQGEGTTVTIHMGFDLLAVNAASRPETASHASDYAAVLAGRNVLLAEDHPLNAQIARRLLEKQGVKVFHAENGRVAVESFAASEVGFFDAVLMDIRMPEMDGNDASRALRALSRPDAGTVPIIAMTANAYPTDVETSYAAGMNAHLAKPIEPTRMYQTLADQIMARTTPA